MEETKEKGMKTRRDGITEERERTWQNRAEKKRVRAEDRGKEAGTQNRENRDRDKIEDCIRGDDREEKKEGWSQETGEGNRAVGKRHSEA